MKSGLERLTLGPVVFSDPTRGTLATSITGTPYPNGARFAPFAVRDGATVPLSAWMFDALQPGGKPAGVLKARNQGDRVDLKGTLLRRDDVAMLVGLGDLARLALAYAVESRAADRITKARLVAVSAIPAWADESGADVGHAAAREAVRFERREYRAAPVSVPELLAKSAHFDRLVSRVLGAEGPTRGEETPMRPPAWLADVADGLLTFATKHVDLGLPRGARLSLKFGRCPGGFRGWSYPAAREIWLDSSRLHSADEALFVLGHEIGHTVLHVRAAGNSARCQAEADTYGAALVRAYLGA